jgi:hypothetical protein
MNNSNDRQPPYTNKGGNPPPSKAVLASKPQKPQINVDWLQYSCEWPDNMPIEDQMTRCVLPYPEFAILPDEIGGISGYTNGRQLRIGRMYWHAKMHSQRVLIVLSGDDWQRIETANIDPMTLIDWIRVKDHRLTRIDLAMDLFHWDANFNDIREWFDHDAMETSAQRCGLYDDHKKLGVKRIASGTVYLGSSASDRQARCYDKGAEQDKKINWLRFELILRADRAAGFLANSENGSLVELARGEFDDFIFAPDTWFSEAISGKMVSVKPIGKRDTDTVKWLIQTVYPALETELQRERDEGDGKLIGMYATLINRFQ